MRPLSIEDTLPWSCQSVVSEEQYQIILGSLLGDASLLYNKNKDKCCFRIDHSLKQSEYLYWKFDQLKDICCCESPTRRKHDAIGFASRYYEEFVPLREKLYAPKKIVPYEILLQLKPLGLAVWYMDDGTLSAKKNCMICTDSYSLLNHEVIIDFFISEYNIHPEVRIHKGKYPRLFFPVTEREKFNHIIWPYIIPTMGYKLKSKIKTCIECGAAFVQPFRSSSMICTDKCRQIRKRRKDSERSKKYRAKKCNLR